LIAKLQIERIKKGWSCIPTRRTKPHW